MLAAMCSYGQTIRGTVKDSAGKAVQYATVNLKRVGEVSMVVYTVTDGKGDFILKAPANIAADSLLVEVRSLGYQTTTKKLVGFDAPLDFTLAAAFNELLGVVIRSQRPVLRSHGDTLGYKVSEFSGPQDRTIGEVIKKMPGITVDADGTIRYNNKAISALYIGGDNLLDDKYTIAANSIPQGAVNQVQVIQNSQPIKVLQNKIMSEEVALNLEIKKGAKLHLMGQENIGVGLPGKYEADLNAMMFKEKYKAINYFKTNNTGYDLQRELVSHNFSSYLQRVDNAVPAPLLSLGSVNNPALDVSRYLFNQSSAVNLNNLVNLQKNVQLRLNASYLHDSQKQDYSQQTSIFLPSDTVKYKETQYNRYVPDIFNTQLTLNVNRENYYLNDILLLDVNNSTRYSALQTDSSSVNQLFTDCALNFSNELSLIRSLRSGKIIQAYSYFSHSTEPENRVIDPGYNPAIFNNNISYAQLVQYVNVPSWYTNNYIVFRIPSKWVTQSFRAGFSVQSQMLSSDLNIVQKNGIVTLKDSTLNHVSWAKQKAYAEASYDLPGSIFKANLTLPLTYQQLNYADNGFKLNQSLRRLYFNPQMNIKYQLNVKNYLSFVYSYHTQIGTIENIYPGYILTDYRTLAANSGNLAEQSIQQAGGGFSHSKALTLFFWSVNAMYSHTHANNISSSVISNNIQKGIVLPYPNSTDSWSMSASISKYVFPLRTTVSSMLQWQTNRSLQIQNNVLLPYITTFTTFNAGTSTKVSNNSSFDYKGAITQIQSHSTAKAPRVTIYQLMEQASINYDLFGKIQIKLCADHYFSRQQNNPGLNYFFADAAVKFKVNKWKTDLELTAVNFLDVKKYSALYLSANAFTASSYTLPGRMLMLKVFFRI